MSALRQELVAFAALAVGFVAFSALVAAGALKPADLAVQNALLTAWRPQLKGAFTAIAFLGGIEVTALAAFGLAAFLWWRGFRDELLAMLAFPIAGLLEITYKKAIVHPGPPNGLQHGDAPSIARLFEGPGAAGANSFPSGHVTRATFVYGLLAFAIWRLAGPGWVRRLAIPVALVVIVLEAFDRLYLDVHWESDVLGALLLGGTCLVGAIVWLDRPRPLRA